MPKHALRRPAWPVAIVALATVIGLTAITPPADAAPGATAGLFGSADPTYDAAYRQSMAILGLTAARAPVPPSASAWLVAQQCASGAFQAYRSDLAAPCAAPDPVNFTGPDSNSTALAAMALRANGSAAAAQRAVAALARAQNADGGWGYTLGSTSDANSTGLALAAVQGAPRSRQVQAAMTRATGYLARIQIACSAPVSSRGALPYQAGQAPNPLASAQGLIGVAGTLPVVGTEPAGPGAATCSSAMGLRIAAFLDQVVRRTDGAIPSALDSTQTDWNTTANAVLALVAGGGPSRAVATGIAALRSNVVAYTGAASSARPAALGTLIQAAVASGASPRSFGGVNLVSQLLSTLQR